MGNPEFVAAPDKTLHHAWLIAKNNIVRLPGSWRLTTLRDRSDVVQNQFDHLISIKNANYLVHPEDVPRLKKHVDSINKDLSPGLSIRLISATGSLHRLEGASFTSEPLESNTSSQKASRDHKIMDPPTADSKQASDDFSVISSDDDPKNKSVVEQIVAGKNLLEAVFNTSTLGLHVLQSVRNAHGEITDFKILLTNTTSDKIAGRKVSGMRMLEGWPHTREIGLFEKFVDVVDTGKTIMYDHLYQGEGMSAWFQWIASKLGDGVYVTIEDITPRKKAAEALERTAARLQSTFDGVPAIIALLEVVTDEAGQPIDFVISAANEATSSLTGNRPPDLIGKRMTDLYPEAFRGDLKQSYFRAFQTGEPQQLEYMYPGFDRWFSVVVTKQVDGHGIVVAAIEITGQKKVEEQRKQNQILAELNRAKTEFFNNISHEFRTPLTIIMGPINTLLTKFDQMPGYSEEYAKLKMVQRNALRLERMVNALLNFSRIEAGKMEVVYLPTDLAEYTTLLAGNFRSMIEDAGLEFRVDCEPTEPVYVNHNMWENIVLNLLSNAFKFTFSGKISVSLRSLKNRIQLQVQDTGIGIASADIEKIFERFTRIQTARSRSCEGTGIGLALVKELVHIHGGSIKVKSRENSGSLFVVSIPKGKAHLIPKNVHELKDKASGSPLGDTYQYETTGWLPGSPEKIKRWDGNIKPDHRKASEKRVVLLVEDNSDMREYVKSILSSHYAVVPANNGETAWNLLAAGLVPSLILSDIMMPERDGFSLLESVRSQKDLSTIPFVFLSAKASEETRIRGLDCGADDYLIKPFTSAELLARISARMRNVRVQEKSAPETLKISPNK